MLERLKSEFFLYIPVEGWMAAASKMLSNKAVQFTGMMCNIWYSYHHRVIRNYRNCHASLSVLMIKTWGLVEINTNKGL